MNRLLPLQHFVWLAPEIRVSAALFSHYTSSCFLFALVNFVSIGKKLNVMALLGDLRQEESRTREILHETRKSKTMAVQFGLLGNDDVCVACLRFFCA
jgi:hypothetical protein